MRNARDHQCKVKMSGSDIYIVHWKSCLKYFILFSHQIKKIKITSKKLNVGFLSVPNLVP